MSQAQLFNNALDSAEEQVALESITNAPAPADAQDLEGIVDRLAYLKAKVAEIRKEEDALKAILSASGKSVIESKFYRCAIVDVPGKATIDWQTIAMKFEPSRQLIRANTKAGEGYTQIRVAARKGN